MALDAAGSAAGGEGGGGIGGLLGGLFGGGTEVNTTQNSSNTSSLLTALNITNAVGGGADSGTFTTDPSIDLASNLSASQQSGARESLGGGGFSSLDGGFTSSSVGLSTSKTSPFLWVTATASIIGVLVTLVLLLKPKKRGKK